MNSADSSKNRRSPPWWDHQHYPLKRLCQAIQRVLATQPSISAGCRVVDFGCGDAPYKPLFTARGCHYVTCDLEGPVDVPIRPGQPLDLPADSVEGVVSFQVLEHVWDLDWYLGEALRVLKPGGWLLLSTHGTWLYHPHPTDYRRWTRDGLVRELEVRGFRVESVEGIVGPLAWTTQFRLLGLREVLRKLPVVGPLLLKPSIVLANLRMTLEDAVTPAWIRDTNACKYLVLARKASSEGARSADASALPV
jgi:SAM-dependent methyltransferase